MLSQLVTALVRALHRYRRGHDSNPTSLNFLFDIFITIVIIIIIIIIIIILWGTLYVVDHSMSGFITQHHNELRDLEAELLSMVCSDVKSESVL